MAMQREPVVGQAPGNRGGKHHEGWDDALEDARKKADGGRYSVEFEVTISSNPGQINEYRVKLTP